MSQPQEVPAPILSTAETVARDAALIVDLNRLTTDLLEKQCHSLVVIGINELGECFFVRRPGHAPHSGMMVNALQQAQQEICTNEMTLVSIPDAAADSADPDPSDSPDAEAAK